MARKRSYHSKDALRLPERAPEPDSRKIGYARVSTEEQNLDMQLTALRHAGVHEDDLFFESVSGVSDRRPALKDALTQCREGDTFIVWRFDRLARSLIQLLNIVEGLEKRGIAFESLTEKIDTKTPMGRFFVQMTGAFAELERSAIVARTRAGVERAKARGVKFGADLKIDLEKAEAMLRAGRSVRETAEACGVARQTVINHFSSHARERLRRLGPLKSKARKRRK